LVMVVSLLNFDMRYILTQDIKLLWRHGPSAE